MINCSVMAECTNVVNFMVFKAYFNVYYRIEQGIWHRHSFLVNGIFCIPKSYEFAPY